MRTLSSSLALATRCLSSAALCLSLSTAGCNAGPRPVEDETDADDRAQKEAAAAAEERVALLENHLAGRFDSTAQAARDTRYFGVSLRACPIQLEDVGTHVLYIEQAMVETLNAPYRQRVYVLSSTEEGGAKSEVHELSDPSKFVGLCDNQNIAAPTASELIRKDGCAVLLREEGDSFVGGTEGKGCESTRNGAAYATSEVTISSSLISSWDRGFDANDVQVWGAEAGPYQFDRKQ